MTHTDKAALKRVGGVEGWEMCIMEAVPGGMLIHGGVPTIANGKKKWPAKKYMDRIILTRADVEAEESLYEAETGNCHNCYGTGQEQAGWSKAEGIRYRECPRCKGIGRVS